jgi:purine nucleosidase
MPAAKIIIDCDPGVDDALALLLSVASPEEIDLVGITCVAGNVPLAQTYLNARRLCLLVGREDMPVLAGCARPIMRAVGPIATVHGSDGLGNIGLAAPEAPSKAGPHAVDFIIEQVKRAPGELILCPIGPMTNIALALVKAPEIAPLIKRIVFMGGAAFCQGNVTPTAEFNFYVDPHAARIVMDSGIPLVMFGLDVTHKVVVTPDWVDRLGAAGKCGEAAAAMLRQYGLGDRHLHDPCVVAWLIDETLFSGSEAHLSVVAEDSPRDGQIVARVKPRHLIDAAPNGTVMTEVDGERFFALLLERIGRLG